MFRGKQPAPNVVTLGAGAAVVSTLVFLLAAAGLADRTGLWILSLVCLVPVLLGVKVRRPAGWPWQHLAVAGLFTTMYLVNALAPETRADAINYHLGQVRGILDTGRLPEQVTFYGILPQGMEMLFLLGTSIGGYSSAKLIHLTFLVATLPLFPELARKLGLPEEAGRAGALLYYCTPVVGASGASAYSDTALVFYILLTAWLVLDERWWQAGLAAGFCYAVKIVGLGAAALAALVLLVRRRGRPAALFCLAAGCMIAPHMLRALVETGNPVAPLMNSWFPNPHFSPAMEQQYTTRIRSYGTTGTGDALLDLLLRGEKVEGLIGPVFFLLPLALLGAKRKGIQWLLAGGGLLSGLWMLNHGARFAMPALALLGLAMAAALPPRVAWAVLAVHAVLSWPHVLRQYAASDGTLLSGIPWRAALRLESEEEYLWRRSFEYNVAKMVERHVPPGAGMLDLFGAPGAYLSCRPHGPYQSADGQRAAEALRLALPAEKGIFYDYEAQWRTQTLTAVRVTIREALPVAWDIQEVALLSGGQQVTPGRGWEVEAKPNVWESAYALDRNLLTGWSTRATQRPGYYWEVGFGRPEALEGLRIISFEARRPRGFEVLGKGSDGLWSKLGVANRIREHPAVNLRGAAARTLKQFGMRFVLTRGAPEGFGWVGLSMHESPNEWGVKELERYGEVYLFRIN